MAYVISDSCVMCGACAGGCPVGAISEGDAQYQIDADACIDCGACAGTCPTGELRTLKELLLMQQLFFYPNALKCTFSFSSSKHSYCL